MKEILCAYDILCLYKGRSPKFYHVEKFKDCTKTISHEYKVIDTLHCFDASCCLGKVKKIYNKVCLGHYPLTVQSDFCPSCYSKLIIFEAPHTGNLICSNPDCSRYTLANLPEDKRLACIEYDGVIILKYADNIWKSTSNFPFPVPDNSFSQKFLNFLKKRFKL